MWALGNEMEIRTTEHDRRPLWLEINHLAGMIHALDPSHPVITVIGDAYGRILHKVKSLAPNLDAVGLNAYNDMLTMPEDVAAEGWDKALRRYRIRSARALAGPQDRVGNAA